MGTFVGVLTSMLIYSSAGPTFCPLSSQVHMTASYNAGFSAEVSARLLLDSSHKLVAVEALPTVAALIGQQPTLFDFTLIHNSPSNGVVLDATYYVKPGDKFSVSWLELPSLQLTHQPNDDREIELSYKLNAGVSQTKQAGFVSFGSDCAAHTKISVSLDGYPFIKTNLDELPGSVFTLSKKVGALYYSIFADRRAFYKDIALSLEKQAETIKQDKLVLDLLSSTVNSSKEIRVQKLANWISQNIVYISRADFYPLPAGQILADKLSDTRGMAALLVILGRLAGINLHLVLASSNAPNLQFYGLSMPLTADCWLVFDDESGKLFDFSFLKQIVTVASYQNILGKDGEMMLDDGNYKPILIRADKLYQNKAAP